MSLSRKSALLVALASLALLLAAGLAFHVRAVAPTPPPVLWAWERPEDLRFLASQPVGVGFLAGSVYLEAQPRVRPRAQPLKVAPGTPVIAVVRLELTPTTPAAFDDQYRNRVASEILHLAAAVPVTALQIDFDALASQHQFYRELLLEVRRQLPFSMPLSITALGSWCVGDDWLRGLPLDEAVPMMFRMGPDRASIEESLVADSDFREPLCRHSVGVSTDEPWPTTFRGRRVYIFSPRPWTESTFSVLKTRLQP
jgi:hypothetical protein